MTEVKKCEKCGNVIGEVIQIASEGGTAYVLKVGELHILNMSWAICARCGAEFIYHTHEKKLAILLDAIMTN